MLEEQLALGASLASARLDMPHTTTPMMGPDGIVMVEALESGVPGLVLARPPSSGHWVLVHAASGLAVSRSAKSDEPEALLVLAGHLGPLADWTRPGISVPGPVLRREVDRALGESGLAGPSRTPTGEPPASSIEQDRELLIGVLREVHRAVPPGVFAKAIEDLDANQRAQLRVLLVDEPADTGAVVQSLPGGEPQPTAAAKRPRKSEPGSAAS